MTRKISKAESLRRDIARREKYARAFDCESVQTDFDSDESRDADATLAMIEYRESVSRNAARDANYDYSDADSLVLVKLEATRAARRFAFLYE